MKRSTLISGIIGGVALWIFGFIFYGIANATEPFQTEEGMAVMKGEDEMSMLWLFIGHLIVGIFSALIYDRWAQGRHNFKNGLVFGTVLGLVIGVGLNVIWYSVNKSMLAGGYVADAVFNVVAYGLMGAVIAFIYSKMEKELSD
ncbi:MAG: hypothetical protein R3275_01925 [Saprospiraceae bacterium]|nr:hypothetical protein [Saprospiraceae bacterium]